MNQLRNNSADLQERSSPSFEGEDMHQAASYNSIPIDTCFNSLNRNDYPEDRDESIVRPSDGSIQLIREMMPGTFRSLTSPGALSHYEIDFTNMADWIHIWDHLDCARQGLLHAIIAADWSGTHNSYSCGLKHETDLQSLLEHLLVLVGVGVGDIMNDPSNKVIRGNLILTSGPNGIKSGRRVIDPRAAIDAINEFKTDYDPAKLMHRRNDRVARVILFEPDVEISEASLDGSDGKTRLLDFFNRNAECLKRWKRSIKGGVDAWILSHEISIRSVLHRTLHPHTHSVIWMRNDGDLDWLLDRARERGYQVRVLDRPHTRWGTLKNLVYYKMKVLPLGEQYRKEFEPSLATELNKSMGEVVRDILRLSGGSEEGRGVGHGSKKFRKSGIPVKEVR